MLIEAAVPSPPGHRLLPEKVRVRGRLAKDYLACVCGVSLFCRSVAVTDASVLTCLVWHVCMLNFMPITPGLSFESVK